MTSGPGLPAVRQYLSEVEKHSGTRFRNMGDLEAIVGRRSDPACRELYEEILFVAKFLSNARKVLGLSGLDASETAPLSAEFARELGRFPGLISSLLSHGSGTGETAGPAGQEDLARLLDLCTELACIKSYELDAARRGEGG